MKSLPTFQYIDQDRLSLAICLAKRDVTKFCSNLKSTDDKTQISILRAASNPSHDSVPVVDTTNNDQNNINNKQTYPIQLFDSKRKCVNSPFSDCSHKTPNSLSCNHNLVSLTSLPARTNSPPVRDTDSWKPNRTRRRALHEPTEKQLKNTEESHIRQLRSKMAQYSIALAELEVEKNIAQPMRKDLQFEVGKSKHQSQKRPPGLGLLKHRLPKSLNNNSSRILAQYVPLRSQLSRKLSLSKLSRFSKENVRLNCLEIPENYYCTNELHPPIQNVWQENVDSLDNPTLKTENNSNPKITTLIKRKEFSDYKSNMSRHLNSKIIANVDNDSFLLHQTLQKFLHEIDESEREENFIRQRWAKLKLDDQSIRVNNNNTDDDYSLNCANQNREKLTCRSNVECPNIQSTSYAKPNLMSNKNEVMEKPCIVFSKFEPTDLFSQTAPNDLLSKHDHPQEQELNEFGISNHNIPNLTTLSLPIAIHKNLLRIQSKQCQMNHQTNWSNLNLGIQFPWIDTCMALVCNQISSDMFDDLLDEVVQKFDQIASHLTGELICSELALDEHSTNQNRSIYHLDLSQSSAQIELATGLDDPDQKSKQTSHHSCAAAAAAPNNNDDDDGEDKDMDSFSLVPIVVSSFSSPVSTNLNSPRSLESLERSPLLSIRDLDYDNGRVPLTKQESSLSEPHSSDKRNTSEPCTIGNENYTMEFESSNECSEIDYSVY